MDHSITETTLLHIQGLSKHFPGVQALDGVNLSLAKGEVLAVIGENGAGKSTLMKILAGVQAPDSGTIRLNGHAVRIDSVRTALGHGIALIHQELNLADNLDIAANIFLGREPRRYGVIDKRLMAREAKQYLAQLDLDLGPGMLVNRLPIGHQQLIEIAKALSVDTRILIMDEPTSSLSSHEAERLYEVIATLKERGVSVIYISHRLGEVKIVADRVVVLRDGKNAGGLAKDEVCHDAMVRMMVGRDIDANQRRTPNPREDVVLAVEDLRTDFYPEHPVSFSIRKGEIVGMAGLVGAGRTEILETIFGVRAARGGTVKVDGQTVSLSHPRDAIDAGVALVPEDRKQQGIILEMNLRENLGLARAWRNAKQGRLDKRAEQALSTTMIEKLNIKTPNDKQVAQCLSGGNQQKVVIGKWLAMEPKVLLLDEPTRGIDVGAKQEIYALMEQMAAEGVAILFVSSEMEEILSMSDRALVVHEGQITGEVAAQDLCEERVMQFATGGVTTTTTG